MCTFCIYIVFYRVVNKIFQYQDARVKWVLSGWFKRVYKPDGSSHRGPLHLSSVRPETVLATEKFLPERDAPDIGEVMLSHPTLPLWGQFGRRFEEGAAGKAARQAAD